MKNTITYAQVLEMAIKVCSVPANKDEYAEVIEKLTALHAKYTAPRATSDEAKAKANAKRKEQTARARAEKVAPIIPILREGLRTINQTEIGVPASVLYAYVKTNLPEDFNAQKVQSILLREMADELVKTERKGKPNYYRLAE